jgi:hypothetical protein
MSDVRGSTSDIRSQMAAIRGRMSKFEKLGSMNLFVMPDSQQVNVVSRYIEGVNDSLVTDPPWNGAAFTLIEHDTNKSQCISNQQSFGG